MHCVKQTVVIMPTVRLVEFSLFLTWNSEKKNGLVQIVTLSLMWKIVNEITHDCCCLQLGLILFIDKVFHLTRFTFLYCVVNDTFHAP